MPQSARVTSVMASAEMHGSLPEALRRRVVIEKVTPEIDCGRFPIKRVIGEEVVVEADAFADGHDDVRCALLHRAGADSGNDKKWIESSMEPCGNDRWRGTFTVEHCGRYQYTLLAWIDHFATWRRGLAKKVDAKQDVSIDLLIGTDLVHSALKHASGSDQDALHQAHDLLLDDSVDVSVRVSQALDGNLAKLVHQWSPRRRATRYAKELAVFVDRPRARFSAWYELFPRSVAGKSRHGTFADVVKHLPYVASMGFDVLYLPPIHPIGRAHRKGRNNRRHAEEGDVGSPWAIGAEEGGHTSIHPQLGTLDEFRDLVSAAKSHGLEIALDIAFQCAPDHPYVREHPNWFRHRPDGTIQYAENPPKKYEDIYPFDFDSHDWHSLWEELAGVIEFWIEQGEVKIFRVDNPHTKPLAFWEWAIDRIKRKHPEVIFLSEAFTRPKLMYRLAKLGFTQSYTYFAWKNTRSDLEEYFTELTRTQVREYFRANAWPNTPDILNESLQNGGRAAFIARVILAGTLAASFGIYGPAFELGERVPREPGSEEYLNSEKYELRTWDLDRPDSLRPLIARLNQIRRENTALQSDHSLRFHHCDNNMLITYSKISPDRSNIVLTAVNLDSTHTQSGWVDLPLDRFGLHGHRPFRVHDLLTGARYTWRGSWNYIELDPNVLPAHIFLVEHDEQSEDGQA